MSRYLELIRYPSELGERWGAAELLRSAGHVSESLGQTLLNVWDGWRSLREAARVAQLLVSINISEVQAVDQSDDTWCEDDKRAAVDVSTIHLRHGREIKVLGAHHIIARLLERAGGQE